MTAIEKIIRTAISVESPAQKQVLLDWFQKVRTFHFSEEDSQIIEEVITALTSHIPENESEN